MTSFDLEDNDPRSPKFDKIEFIVDLSHTPSFMFLALMAAEI